MLSKLLGLLQTMSLNLRKEKIIYSAKLIGIDVNDFDELSLIPSATLFDRALGNIQGYNGIVAANIIEYLAKDRWFQPAVRLLLPLRPYSTRDKILKSLAFIGIQVLKKQNNSSTTEKSTLSKVATLDDEHTKRTTKPTTKPTTEIDASEQATVDDECSMPTKRTRKGN